MTKNRRDFLINSTLGIGTLGIASISKNSIANAKDLKKNSVANFTPASISVAELPKLDYAYDALEPYIDKETMFLHHTKHHQAYVDGLNNANKKLQQARENNDYNLIEHWSKKASFHGGGHFLHSLFWKCLVPKNIQKLQSPNGILLKQIEKNFGNFDNFKLQFSATALAVEGSGWALLQVDNQSKSLSILIAENQHKLTPWGVTPILGIDVWEHAYYLKYQNKRADYINAWWEVVNWENIGKFYESTWR